MLVDHAAIESATASRIFEPMDGEAPPDYDLVAVPLPPCWRRGGQVPCGTASATSPVYPGVNTSFYGAVPKAGFFVELCGGAAATASCT